MLSFFPRNVLDWILDLIESVPDGFSTYCSIIIQFSSSGCTFYAPEGTSGGILKSHRPSVRPFVTNRVSAIAHKLLKQI